MPIQADQRQIEQVILNLVLNARDAMPNGGKLTITTENVVMDKKQAKASSDSNSGKWVCLSVSDTGIGMDQETIQHIFEPFFTTKVDTGTGLGLAVVYGIIKQHGGWIDVQSELKKGTAFKIYLPAVSIKYKTEAQTETYSLQESGGNGERILIVEDDPKVRLLATRLLRESCYVVFEAKNAEEALDIFDRENGDIQLLFTDVILPDKNGVQLAEQLKSINPELHILLNSGYTNQRTLLENIQEKGFVYIQKPYSLISLLKIVKSIFAGNDNEIKTLTNSTSGGYLHF
jgi:CheY-like chemotaxis protein